MKWHRFQLWGLALSLAFWGAVLVQAAEQPAATAGPPASAAGQGASEKPQAAAKPERAAAKPEQAKPEQAKPAPGKPVPAKPAPAKPQAAPGSPKGGENPPAAEAAQDLLQRMGLLRRVGPYQKDHADIKAAFREVVKQARASVVRVTSKGKLLAQGTVVDARGYIATKASELAEPVEVQLSEGRTLPARVVALHPDFDLALLQVEATDLVPITWREELPPAVGSWLVTPGQGVDPLALGVVSVAPRRIAGESGVLGVALDDGQAGPVIKEVMKKSAAERAGLQVGDLVTRLNGHELKNREAMIREVRKFKPGDSITLRLLRGQEELEIAATLGRPQADERGQRRENMNSMGGPLSERRRGFPLVLQHDTVLQPNECGGPVLDLSGKAVGLNIARAGRVESYAVPADEVRKLLPDLLAGKFPPTTPLTNTASGPASGNEKPAEGEAGKPATAPE